MISPKQGYQCEHFTFECWAEIQGVRNVVVHTSFQYHERHIGMSVKDYRGMLKAMMQLDEYIGDYSEEY